MFPPFAPLRYRPRQRQVEEDRRASKSVEERRRGSKRIEEDRRASKEQRAPGAISSRAEGEVRRRIARKRRYVSAVWRLERTCNEPPWGSLARVDHALNETVCFLHVRFLSRGRRSTMDPLGDTENTFRFARSIIGDCLFDRCARVFF